MKIRLFEAFAGYGSQALAMDRIKEAHSDFDYEVVGISEIDKYAVQAYEALHGSVKNYGDISKIDWSEVPNFDMFTYSSPCFVAGTKVLTNEGYKNIEDIQDGDMVFTHEGRFNPVIATGSDGYKPIYEISTMGTLPIRCTYNHPFYVSKRMRVWNNAIRRWRFQMSEPYKCRVQDFEGDEYLSIPILPSVSASEYSKEVLWLVGRYMADGHITGGELIMSIGQDKISDFDNISIHHRIYKHTPSCYRVVFNRTSIAYKAVKELTNCGKAIDKAFNGRCLFYDKDCVKALLDGYMSGDGYYIEKCAVYQATTISEILASQLVLMVQKVHEVGVKIYKDKRPEKYIIEGREVNQHDTYLVRFQTQYRKKSWLKDGNFIWYPVREVKDLGREEKIYNINVSTDHTYTANNVTCFNCQDWSNAGLQKGGAEGSGTRSSLLWECKRAIIAKKPKYCMLENVKALTSKKFLPYFLQWCDWLTEQGYRNFWKVLNAKDYGVPQNRERVFLFSILDDNARYVFPKPFELKNCLADLLEPSVSEEFYLSEKSVEGFRLHNENHEKKGTGFV